MRGDSVSGKLTIYSYAWAQVNDRLEEGAIIHFTSMNNPSCLSEVWDACTYVANVSSESEKLGIRE